jgi:hypothetical protein
MKKIIRLFKRKQVTSNIKPIRTTVLPTGLVCEEYLNGTIKII